MNNSIICPIDLYYKAKSDSVSINVDMPVQMQQGLDRKKLIVKSFYIENNNVPMFIPEMQHGNYERQVDLSASTYSSFPSSPSRTIDSLGYTISFTDLAKTTGVDIFIQHDPDYFYVPPMLYPTDTTEFQEQKYYWYRTFTDFLKNISHQVSMALPVVYAQAGIVLPSTVIFEFSVTSDNYIQLVVDKTTVENFDITFSDSLRKILPFDCTGDTNELEFTTINAITFDSTDCFYTLAQFYSNIFPFVELVFASDTIPLQNTQFLVGDNVNFSSQQSIFRQVILKYKVINNMPTVFRNYWEYVNDNPQSNYYSFSQPQPLNNRMTIDVYLRTRENVLIRYPFAKDDIFIMDLDIVK